MSLAIVPHSRARLLAAALGSVEDDLLAAVVDAPLCREDALWLTQQSLAPYMRYRLRRAGLWEFLTTAAAETLSHGYALSAVHETVQHSANIVEALGALHRAGVEFVVLKGLALAYTVYPAPHLRPKSDADLWIPREQISLAVDVLRRLGYTPRLNSGSLEDESAGSEGEILLTQAHTTTTKIEVQFPPMRGLWARTCARIDHTALWQRTETVMIDGQMAKVLSPADAILHTAFHQAINHQFTYPCWLRSLLDIHFIVLQGNVAWNTLIESARAWRLRTLTWTVLDLAHRLLGTPIPSSVLAALRPSALHNALLEHLPIEASILEARPADYRLLRYGVQAAMMDRAIDGIGLAREALFPDSRWLRARYALPTTTHPLHLQLHHWRRLVTAHRA